MSEDRSQNQPVPQWEHLPAYAQAELSAAGFGAPWFDSRRGDDTMRLTVLNLYVKLRGLELWRFVHGDAGTAGAGCLEFTCTDVNGLIAALDGRSDFTAPGERPLLEEDTTFTREKKGDGALHLKQFDGYAEARRFQAHIDPVGLYADSSAPIPLDAGQALAHWIDDQEKGWTQVYKIRDILLREGWDPAPLLVG